MPFIYVVYIWQEKETEIIENQPENDYVTNCENSLNKTPSDQPLDRTCTEYI